MAVVIAVAFWCFVGGYLAAIIFKHWRRPAESAITPAFPVSPVDRQPLRDGIGRSSPNSSDLGGA